MRTFGVSITMLRLQIIRACVWRVTWVVNLEIADGHCNLPQLYELTKGVNELPFSPLRVYSLCLLGTLPYNKSNTLTVVICMLTILNNVNSGARFDRKSQLFIYRSTRGMDSYLEMFYSSQCPQNNLNVIPLHHHSVMVYVQGLNYLIYVYILSHRSLVGNKVY